MLGSLGAAGGMQDAGADAYNQQASSLGSLSADPSQLAGGGEFAALSLVGGLASGSASSGLASGTDAAIGGTVSSLLSSGLLGQNATVNATGGNGTNATAATARRWRRAGRRYWRGRRSLLKDRGTEAPTPQPTGLPTSWPTFAPTVALADDEALGAVAMDAIGAPSMAWLLVVVPQPEILNATHCPLDR